MVFDGYQAEGPKGRRLVDGEPQIQIYGNAVPVKATIYSIDGLSAHADQDELMEWADGFVERPNIVFVVHGEEKVSEVLAKKLHGELRRNIIIPNYLESVLLFDGI
ncbi:MAG: metallo-beta-lactamase family protein [Algoriphagus sp.]